MPGSVNFSQMARSWALVPRPRRPAAARRHPATCRLLQPTPDPNTGGAVRAGGLAGWLAGQATWAEGTYPCTRRWRCSVRVWRPGLASGLACLAVWSGFLHLFPRLAAYPHPPAVPQSVGKGSLPELRSHLLPSPPLVFLLPPTDPGSRFNLPLFPSFLAVSPARRTQTRICLTRPLPCSIVSLHTGSHSPPALSMRQAVDSCS